MYSIYHTRMQKYLKRFGWLLFCFSMKLVTNELFCITIIELRWLQSWCLLSPSYSITLMLRIFSVYFSYFDLSLLQKFITQLWASGRGSEGDTDMTNSGFLWSLVHLSLILKHKKKRGDYESIFWKGHFHQINTKKKKY